jgi:hypothetical protein
MWPGSLSVFSSPGVSRIIGSSHNSPRKLRQTTSAKGCSSSLASRIITHRPAKEMQASTIQNMARMWGGKIGTGRRSF